MAAGCRDVAAREAVRQAIDYRLRAIHYSQLAADYEIRATLYEGLRATRIMIAYKPPPLWNNVYAFEQHLDLYCRV